MAGTKKKATAAFPINDASEGDDTKAAQDVAVQPRRCTRKRKQIHYGKRKDESKVKKVKTREVDPAESAMADTIAAPPLEPMKPEGFGHLAVEPANLIKPKKEAAPVDTSEHIGDTPMRGTTCSTVTDPKASDVTKLMQKSPQAMGTEESSKNEEAPSLSLPSMNSGPHTTSASTNEPIKKMAPKLESKSKMRRLKKDSNEMAVNKNGRETRKSVYLHTPSADYAARKARALSQPIRFVDRERCDTATVPMEKYTIVGNVGAKYTVHFGYVPKCTCPDYLFRKTTCKHIIYVKHKVLKIPDPFAHQEAYLSAELRQIFENAPSAPSDRIEDVPKDPKRKPIEGECPICYMDFEPDTEPIDYCRAGCGNNVHRLCMDMWTKAQKKKYHKATCPYCRHDWTA